MRALTFQGLQKISLENVPDPRLVEPTDVLVQVEITAICGSDLHPYFGREVGIDAGTIPGHEAVGTVVEIGSAVRKLRRGDRVFGPFTTCCGDCFYCRAGLTCRCVKGQLFGWVEKGKGLQGLQAELARIPWADSTLMKIPEGITPEEALLLGDVLSTGYFCADQAGIRSDGTYAVVGCGPVGLMAIVGAKALGAKHLYAIDPIPERRKLAERYGAQAIDPSKESPVEIVCTATEGRGADAVLEVVGNESAERAAWELVRPGGTISVVGVHNDPGFSFTPAEAYAKNLTYRVGRCPARYYMEKLVPLVASRQVDFSPLFSHRLALSEGARGYRLFADRDQGCTKVILTP